MGYKLVIDGVPVSEYDIFGEACTAMLLEMEKSVREYEKSIDIVDGNGRITIRASWVAYENWDVNVYFIPE